MTSLASLTIAVLAPFLGSFADAKNRRKTMLFLFTLIGALSTGTLWIIYPDKSFMLEALIISFCSIVAMELTFVFYNSLLTSVALPHQIGKVSGISWGFGYFGANICLIDLSSKPENSIY